MSHFFILSKTIWFAIEPSHLLVWALIAAALQSARRKRSGAVLAGLCALWVTILLFAPVGHWALKPIEDQTIRPKAPEHVDGIVVLGEGLIGRVFETRGVPGVGSDGGTLIAARILAQRYPGARMIYSGNRGEAAVAASLFQEMGMENGRLTIDDRSNDTWENILLAHDIAKPVPGETWLLVGMAYHLPRAMAVADKLGWSMTPWPSNYFTIASGKEFLALPTNLGHLDIAVHEWVGLAIYRLTGKAR